MLEVVNRRLELLKLEGLGLSQAEIVKQVSKKMACSERTIYSDFECRQTWQPLLQGTTTPAEVLLKVINRYEEIYRQASRRMFSSSNELAQLGALNIMLKANFLMSQTAALPELINRLKALEDKTKKGVFVP
jgi:hypothetical protein